MGPKYFRAEGELWRAEWIEAADRSERVRGDESSEVVTFIVDAGGARQPHAELDHEDVGRYLWFDPHVMPVLLKWRDSELRWYTRETGSIACSHGYRVHFGVNRIGLVNAYAKDVAGLPLWQKKLWAAHNVPPDGVVSAELLASQMKARPAHTKAAEEAIGRLMQLLDADFARWAGGPLFQPHVATADILKSVHRFRAVDQGGLLALAKDIARITADSFDIGTLRRIVRPPKGEN